ncbi:MAG: glycoside hydrolase family 9 protein [Verrucomicrobiota bacterium]|jgi:endoglucanase
MRIPIGKNVGFDLAIIGLLLCVNARAAIALHDGSIFSTNVTGAGVQTIANHFTVTAGATVMVAALWDNNGYDTTNGSPSFMTWSNATLGTTQILMRAVSQNEGAYTYSDCDLFYLFNPSPGTGVVSATDLYTNGTTPTMMFMQTYTLGGVATSAAPFAAGNGNATASSLTINTPASTANASWAAVMSVNYNGGGGNIVTNTASSGGAVGFNFQPAPGGGVVQMAMGYITNLSAGVSTITASASGVPTHMAMAAMVLTPASGMAAPTNVTAAGQLNQVALSWNDASGGVATNYTIYRLTSSGSGYSAIATNNGNANTSYTDTAVTDWTTYYYEVTASGSAGVSLFSFPPASAAPMGLPTIPTGLAATAGNALVLLTWNAEPGATNFNVLRSTTNGSGFSPIASVTTTGYTDYPLVNGTTYYYEVNATNRFGTSGNTAQVSATPSVTATNAYPPIAEIRTASDTVLVAFFIDTNWWGDVTDTQFNTNQVDTSNLSLWTLNGQPVSSIDEFVTEANAVEYHIYLHVPKLTNGMAYTLSTPNGSRNFVFDDTQIFCEAIKVNQNGYSALSHVRYANFAIWLGTGGAKQISGPLPTYTVINQFTGEQVTNGTLQTVATAQPDTSSGDYVYRIDLSGVPEGGPYQVVVDGYGCSYPFGVGGDFSRRLAYVAFRGLYYQRCGCPIVKPYAWADIRLNPCHTNVYDLNKAPPSQDDVVVTGTEPKLLHYGEYHDGGDADRLVWHMMVPIVLMSTYEAFPNLFTDDQFNIPDKFDSSFHIVGKGNGIPDILDEASWGVMYWEYMQSTSTEPAGAVHWGDSTSGFPNFGIPLDQDPKLYGTLTNVPISTGFAAGLFMHLARLIKPYDAAMSTNLQQRADAAYNAVGSGIPTDAKLYYSIQKYLLTGDTTASNVINSLASTTSALKNTYNWEAGGFIGDSGGNIWLASYFMSYLLATNRPTNPTVVQQFKTALKDAADQEIGYLNGDAYPVGWPTNINPTTTFYFNYGAYTSQGEFAYPCLMEWALTGQQQYIDAVSQLMDYDQGLNPLGKCYLTGIGFNRVYHPHQRESDYAQRILGVGGPQPGFTVYGPTTVGRAAKQIPPFSGLPRERLYADHLGFWENDEGGVYQNKVFPAAVYPVLAQGGTWNPTREPYLNPAASIQSGTNGRMLQFGGIPYQTYVLQSATNINGPWSTTSGPVAADVTGTVRFTDTSPASSTEYYRTEYVPPGGAAPGAAPIY